MIGGDIGHVEVTQRSGTQTLQQIKRRNNVNLKIVDGLTLD